MQEENQKFPLSENNDQEDASDNRKKKILVSIAVILIVFIVGVGIGRSNIWLGSDSVFRNPVGTNGQRPLDYGEVNEIYADLAESFDGDLDPNKLEEGLKEGLVDAAGDPYTEYLDQEEAKSFNEQLNGSFEGIGAELNKENEAIVVVTPIAGFPAEKAGLKAGDIISEIDGKTAYDLGLTEAVNKIRGEAGTKVKLGIVRDGRAFDVNIERAQIDIPSVESEILPGKIGLMTVSRYGDDTVSLATKAAQKFRDEEVKGVILDLRGNPGGSLEAAVDLSSLWLPSGDIILEEKRDNQTVETFRSNGNDLLVDLPTVVLINGGSASASEITAGALSDNSAATLIGEKSFGKGSVQELRELEDGGLLKVTIARWFTPNGVNIDEEGIAPDKKVKLTEKDAKNDRDPQQAAALKFLRK